MFEGCSGGGWGLFVLTFSCNSCSTTNGDGQNGPPEIGLPATIPPGGIVWGRTISPRKPSYSYCSRTERPPEKPSYSYCSRTERPPEKTLLLVLFADGEAHGFHRC